MRYINSCYVLMLFIVESNFIVLYFVIEGKTFVLMMHCRRRIKKIEIQILIAIFRLSMKMHTMSTKKPSVGEVVLILTIVKINHQISTVSINCSRYSKQMKYTFGSLLYLSLFVSLLLKQYKSLHLSIHWDTHLKAM